VARQGTGTSYIHIDLDVLDPEVGTANWFGSAGGLSLDDLLTILAKITGQSSPGVLTLSAYDPTADQTGAIARAAVTIGELITSGGGVRT
jgi:arginase family enzyme